MSSDLLENDLATDLTIGPSAIDAYSRLSYKMWYALAEFIDNSTQSRINNEAIIDAVLAQEGQRLTVTIDHDRKNKKITITDNSIGMTRADLEAALKVAHPTPDSKGRSKYGMGMKTAACWIGKKWKIITCEWSSGEEWTAEIDVHAVAYKGARIPLSVKKVSADAHYTIVEISEMHRRIQQDTETTIKGFLGSMYQFDLKHERLKLVYNEEDIVAPEAYEFDTDPEGKQMYQDLPPKVINGKQIKGWFGILKKGGRKFGGFSLFQNDRQIQGFPNAWKPRSIFGGVDEEGANNLVSQRLTGLIQLDGFKVSHTKDQILFDDDEEEQLEEFLKKTTDTYRRHASKPRGTRQIWSPEKIRDLLEGMRDEFTSPEMSDALSSAVLPSLDAILFSNQQQLDALTDLEKITDYDMPGGLKVVVSLQNRSDNDPYVTLVAGAEGETIHVIINALHPYYVTLEISDAIEECIRQYVYDAIAEYKVGKMQGKVTPDSVRRLKNDLLRVQMLRAANAADQG